MQHLPDIEKIDSENESFCLNWKIHKGGRKVCVNLKTDTDNLKFVVYRYRNSLYLKDNEYDPKLTKYQSILSN